MGDVEQLHDLQAVDTALDQLSHRRAHLPSRAAHDAARAASEGLRSRLAQNAKRRDEVDAQYAALEKTGAEIDAKVTRLEGQLRSVVVTREAEAIQREISSLRAERDAGDEAGLAMLEEVESLAAAATQLQVELEGALAAEQAAAEVLAVDDQALDGERQALQRQRDEMAAALPAGLLSEYEGLRKSFNGVAVARLNGSQCTGCHIVLSRVELEAVRAVPADDRAECPHCARLLAR